MNRSRRIKGRRRVWMHTWKTLVCNIKHDRVRIERGVRKICRPLILASFSRWLEWKKEAEEVAPEKVLDFALNCAFRLPSNTSFSLPGLIAQHLFQVTIDLHCVYPVISPITKYSVAAA